MASSKFKSFKKPSFLKNQKKNSGSGSFKIYILIVALGFILADLGTIWIKPFLIPKKTPTAFKKSSTPNRMILLSDYKIIETKNIFNSKGIIPPPLSGQDSNQNIALDGEIILSSLPLQLIGTIVHINSKKSVASIKLTSLKKTDSFKVGDHIGKMAELILVERRKIIIRNINRGRNEYIEIPDKDLVSFGAAKSVDQKIKNSQISQTDKFNFKIKRSTLKKYTKNLSSILNQARMLPRTSGGKVNGFRFVSIKPDSIYTKLGFKSGDVILAVNGEPVTSPSQAMELYNSLKSSDEVELSIERNGKVENFKYNIQ